MSEFNVSEEMLSEGTVRYGDPGWENVLAKLDDPNKDAFEKMIVVSFEVMPGIALYQEDLLASVGFSLADTGELTDVLSEAQNILNAARDIYDYEEGFRFSELLQQLSDEISTASDEGLLDPTLANQMTGAISEILDHMETIYPSDPGSFLHQMWVQASSGFGNDLNFMMNKLNVLGSGLKSFSGILQTEMQIEIGQYESWVAVYKDMFSMTKAQIDSPIKKYVQH